ncbi:retrovirus-related Pol polyprotein from transposon 297 [Trichonephila inaurata madagascariensis]|uniref:RNA-directed DNA polymerase n=1 Tax=Trichonephila inaurata madagascariensis TaxID=2747483 RepID=A0A8X6YGZ0_9ARAC|nr:retrovirus-related Pol polyprotein from transposon 297 [Trichonephila inaurata madagascariensis]
MANSNSISIKIWAGDPIQEVQVFKKEGRVSGAYIYIVENGTISPPLSKTLAVRKFPQPTTLRQVQSFLGLTGYFRKSIPEYSKIAKPLSDLLRKDNSFFFEQPPIEAFGKLKEISTSNPVLHIFKPAKKTELHTDASQQGYGAVLLQEADDGRLHPVYYMSKKTNAAEEKYSSYELEVLAIVAALKKLRAYLLGHKVKIVANCSAFQKPWERKIWSHVLQDGQCFLKSLTMKK